MKTKDEGQKSPVERQDKQLFNNCYFRRDNMILRNSDSSNSHCSVNSYKLLKLNIMYKNLEI